MELYYSLNEYYSKNASFLMNRSTLKEIRLLKSESTGQYIWQPSLSLSNPDTLIGIPVYQSSEMPSLPNSNQMKDTSLPVISIGDFKQAYKIVDNRGMKILRDPYTNKPYVRFFITKRVGGAVINTKAIKLLKIISRS